MSERPYSPGMITISPEGLRELFARLARALEKRGAAYENPDAVKAPAAPEPMCYTTTAEMGDTDANMLLDALKELLFKSDKITLLRVQALYSTACVIDPDEPDVRGDSVYITINAAMDGSDVSVDAYIALRTEHSSAGIEGTINTEYSRGNMRIGFGRTDFSGEDLTDPQVIQEVVASSSENERPIGLIEAQVISVVTDYVEHQGSQRTQSVV